MAGVIVTTKPPGAILVAVVLVFSLLVPAASTPQTLAANAGPTTRKVEFAQLWSFLSEKSYVASPVFADGLIYVVTANSGSGIGTLYCINASSGNQEWNITSIFQTSTVANGHVYIGGAVIPEPSTRLSLLGVVSCLDAKDGNQVWNYSYGTGLGAPVVNGGIAYVPGFNYTLFSDINFGFVFALNALTGAKIWDSQGPVGTRFDDGSLVLANGNLYALSAVYTEKDRHLNSAIYAFDAATGEELWHYSAPGRFRSLVASGQILYVTSNFENTTDITGGTAYDGGVLALNASDGAKIWSYSISSSVESLITAEDSIYVVAGNGDIYAFDASNGRANWICPTGLNTGPASLVNGHLYVGSSAGVICIDAATGHVLWNFEADEFAESSATFPVYSEGLIYVGWNGPQFFSRVTRHNFYAVDAFTGEEAGNLTLDYAIKSSPVVVNGTVYIGASWVTEESIDYLGPGAVIALNSTITEVPLSPSPFSSLAITLIAVVVVALIAGLLLFFKKRKRQTIA